jgi:hypothetical protein
MLTLTDADPVANQMFHGAGRAVANAGSGWFAAWVSLGPVVDVHSHFMPLDLPDLGASTADGRWPSLRTDDGGTGPDRPGRRNLPGRDLGLLGPRGSAAGAGRHRGGAASDIPGAGELRLLGGTEPGRRLRPGPKRAAGRNGRRVRRPAHRLRRGAAPRCRCRHRRVGAGRRGAGHGRRRDRHQRRRSGAGRRRTAPVLLGSRVSGRAHLRPSLRRGRGPYGARASPTSSAWAC